jgi:A/G-specific adenine glycosylase
VSEIMLQQTQVARVVPYYERWLEDFPTLEALAAAPLEAVLRAWQGLGYNRRAVALKQLAEELVARAQRAGGVEPARVPDSAEELIALPGVGPATAAGVRAFAYGHPAGYLETNVRAVVLHELFSDADGVPDTAVRPLVEQAAAEASRQGIDSRTWNYALLDYGAHLKSSVENPSRRSAHHARQSAFEGSRRQKRARLLRAVLDVPGLTAEELSTEMGIAAGECLALLEELTAEGFVSREADRWRIR